MKPVVGTPRLAFKKLPPISRIPLERYRSIDQMDRFSVSGVYRQQNLCTESICLIGVICLAIKLIVLDVYIHSQDEEILAGNRGRMNNTTFCA